jgi:hypothetical protein
LTLLVGADFAALFTSFEATADRLEVRDRYSDPVEDEALRRYLNGEVDDLAWSQEWFDQIRALARQGRRFRRVRVVTLPLSDYQRWGVEAIAPHNVAAGEEIRYIDRSRAGDSPGFDFWLFDTGTPRERAARLHFDRDDHLLGAEIITDTDVIKGLAASWDATYEAADSAESFARQHDLR